MLEIILAIVVLFLLVVFLPPILTLVISKITRFIKDLINK